MGGRTQSVPRALADAGLPDRYRLTRLIARGGMGTVWCAEDVMLGRSVALKLLADHFVDDDRAVRRFMREARTAGRLSGHRNIVTIFDVGQTTPDSDATPSRPFIVMEHLPCGSVADAIRRREVRGSDPVRWLQDAAAALDYAHEQGVIHRDIKPGNMLLDRQRNLHVGDFGIARVATEDTTTGGGTMFGTAAYVSPEQALGRRATEASDRYALAVVAFELLTGERPFRGEHFAAQARQHIEEEPPRASSVAPNLPPGVDAVLLRGLAKRPEDRWPTAAAFADAVAAAVRPRPVRRRADPPPTVRTTTSRRPRGVALAALAAGALIIGAAVGASHDDRAPRTTAAAIHRPGHATTTAAAKPKRHTRRHPAPPAHAAGVTTSSAATSSPAAAASSSPNSASTSGGSPDALEARGHALMMAGQYAQAIPVLRQAVASAPHGSLTYAYALYDLGRSLRLAGDPGAAIPILQARLQIPNQTDVVRHELQLALQAAGAGSTGAGAAPAGSGGAAAGGPGAHAGKHGGGRDKTEDKHGG
jgi:eukaryotic-like serine/threonine-protein kinase